MTHEELQSQILKLCPDAVVSMGKQYTEVLVSVKAMHKLALELKTDPGLAFDYLFCLSGADFPEYMTVYYHLESTSHKHAMLLKVNSEGRENPVIDSVSDIWLTAEFHEREIYDLLGVKFNNHPDLRRLFLGDDWGYPLRKDYVDDVRIVDR